MFYLIERKECGSKGLGFSGCNVEIETQSFFHGSATQRKQRNFIKGLKDADGTWCEDEDLFWGWLTTYYADLLKSSNPRDLDRVLDGVQRVVNEDMQVDLARPYKVDEVEFAIKEMAHLKAPAPTECLHCSTKHIGLRLVWMSPKLSCLV